MALPDTSDVDAALVALLSGDASLMALMPGGVFFDAGQQGVTKFVLVTQAIHEDTYVFRASLYERLQYTVRAVHQSTSGTEVKKAAARIHELLQDQRLQALGYAPSLLLERVERVRYRDDDEISGLPWMHRGGIYEIWEAPA